MKTEKPIIFCGAMVRAIMKTVTRRVVNRDLWDQLEDGRDSETQRIETDDTPVGGLPAIRFCRYSAGDRLWVKENVWMWCDKQPNGKTKTGRNRFLYVPVGKHTSYQQEKPSCLIDNNPRHVWRLKVARFMPRWAARLFLEVLSVTVERVQDITEKDAIAEGVYGMIPKVDFRFLWNSLNSKRGFGWHVNPWVWRIAFRRIK